MKKIAIVAPALLPIPPTKGGAVEHLVNHFIEENEKYQKLELTIVTPFEKKAFEIAKKYKNTNFLWFKPREGFAAKIRNRIFRHIICPLRNIEFYNDNQAQIIKLLKKDQFDKIILESNSEFVNTLGRIFSKDKIVCHLHIRPKDLREGIYENCKAVFSVSEYVKQEIIKNTDTPSDKIFVLKNCVNTSFFKKNDNQRKATRQKYNLTENTVAICYVGRLVEMKGVKHLIDAVVKLDSQRDFKLFIIGALSGHFKDGVGNTSPFVQNLFNAAKQLSDKVIFTDFIDNANLPVLLNGMDIAVMPTMYKEAAPLNNLEYQSIGLPIITTNMGGIIEYVTDETACIVENDSNLSESILEKLEYLISNKEARIQMGVRGIEYAKNFDTSNYLNSLIYLLDRIDRF